MNLSQLLKATKDLTSISNAALARKIGAKSKQVGSWESEETNDISETQMEKLNKFYQNALASKKLLEEGVPPFQAKKRPHGVKTGLVCGDCIEYVANLPANSVDMILSDIPYGIDHDSWDVLHTNSNTALLGSSEAQKKSGAIFQRRRKPLNGWSSEDRKRPLQYYEWCKTWAPGWMRALKPGGSAVVFCGRRYMARCVAALEDSGFILRDMLSWEKTRAPFRAQNISNVFRKRGLIVETKQWEGWRVGNLAPKFEPVIWMFKPYKNTLADNCLDYGVGAFNVERFKELNGSYDNILRFGYEKGERGLHETQKPVSMMRALIELCTLPGALVMDPFAGSGSTGVAAIQASRQYLMIEKDPSHFSSMENRIKAAK